MAPYVKMGLEPFSCTEGNELIPKIAAEYGFEKPWWGVWLEDDLENKRKKN